LTVLIFTAFPARVNIDGEARSNAAQIFDGPKAADQA
jgi:hypothetical protein